MGKASALRRGITKGVQHVARTVLPQEFRCPVCKYQFSAYETAVEAKERNISPEELVGNHIMSCIATLKGQARCPECGEVISGKNFKEHMDTIHPIEHGER